MNFSTGQQLLVQKEFGKALEVFLNLKKSFNKNNEILFYLGLIYFELNDFKNSIYYYKKFLKKAPNSILGLYKLALAEQSIGEIDAAKNIYSKLIEIDKNKVRPYYGLFTLNPKYLDDNKFKTILDIKNNHKHSLFEEGIINFLLSKREQKNENYFHEIQYLKKSHRLIFESKKEYNISTQFYYDQILSKFYDKLKFKNEFQNNEIIPIFIIGLPRSGSTLVEAILSSGSEDANCLGECHVINASILEQIGPKIYSKNFNFKNFNYEINLDLFHQSTIKRYNHFNYKKKFKRQVIIDKSLENFFNVEAILQIFPNAKFLHTFRNPYDSIISIYQSMLAELPWTHSIENIIMYINNYLNVVKYFKNKYPQIIMDVNLEELTSHSEHVSKEMYKFCGFKWSKNALNYYKRDNLHSKTLSFAQIRNKVFNYDKKKYQPYFYLIDKYKEKFDWLKESFTD